MALNNTGIQSINECNLYLPGDDLMPPPPPLRRGILFGENSEIIQINVKLKLISRSICPSTFKDFD